MKFDPLQDGKSSIELIDYMGSDIDIVNAARVSFSKQVDKLSEKDEKLIHYLIKHRHTSPLRGVVFKMRVVAPLSIGRQWWKHVVASSHVENQLQHNEQSLRYVEVEPEFYIPKEFRAQSQSNKQASDGVVENQEDCLRVYESVCEYAANSYEFLIKQGVARELARNILPPAQYTSWINTMSLQAMLHFVSLRLGKGAQSEIVRYAECMEQMIQQVAPIAYEAWKKHG